MDFKQGIMRAIGILKLDGATIKQTAQDSDSFAMALIIPILAGIAMAIGSLNPFGIIILPVFIIIGLFIGTAILWVTAMLLGGKAGFMELLKPLGHSEMLNWITVIPILGPMISPLLGIYMLVVGIATIKHVYNFSWGKAIAVVAIPTVIIGVLMIIAGIAAFTFITAMLASAQ